MAKKKKNKPWTRTLISTNPKKGTIRWSPEKGWHIVGEK